MDIFISSASIVFIMTILCCILDTFFLKAVNFLFTNSFFALIIVWYSMELLPSDDLNPSILNKWFDIYISAGLTMVVSITTVYLLFIDFF